MLSVARAFDYLGAEIVVAHEPETIAKAEYLVLPGVGAFAKAMVELKQLGFIEPIRRYAQSGRPFLGICLGMQMMLDSSDEFGHHEGLGLIAGQVVAIPRTGTGGQPHKIPHIGWSQLRPTAAKDWSNSILCGLEDDLSLYFVHSFMAMPACSEHRLAETNYNGCLLPAAIRRDNLYGLQCHPEKSGAAGLTILERFLTLN